MEAILNALHEANAEIVSQACGKFDTERETTYEFSLASSVALFEEGGKPKIDFAVCIDGCEKRGSEKTDLQQTWYSLVVCDSEVAPRVPALSKTKTNA
ncbi:hypothetical protein Q5752_001763 [Cryptotrichosporon argae]